MLKPADDFFMRQPEPAKTCLQYLRQLALGSAVGVQEKMSYGMPFYYLSSRRFCYLWVHKATGMPYMGIVNGASIDFPGLVTGDRTRMKVVYVDAEQDVPVGEINNCSNWLLLQLVVKWSLFAVINYQNPVQMILNHCFSAWYSPC